MWLKDKNGAYNLDNATAVTANKDGKAVIHLNGGEITTDSTFDDVVSKVLAPAPAPEAK